MFRSQEQEQELAEVHLQWADDRERLAEALIEVDTLEKKYLDLVQDCQFQDRRYHEKQSVLADLILARIGELKRRKSKLKRRKS